MKCEHCKMQIRSNKYHSDDSGEYHLDCHEKLMRQSAIDAGIPESVIDGKTKLTDHFSQEYIDSQARPSGKHD